MDKNSSLYKTVLLGGVCAVAGVLLSAVNSVTAPKIEENKLAAVKTILEEFFPNGSFKDITENYQDDADHIDGVYEADGEGYIFTLHSTGYDAGGFTFAVAFDNDGNIVGYKGLEQKETAGKGSKLFEDDYANQVKELTSADNMPVISGATVTSNAVNEAVRDAEEVVNGILGLEGNTNSAEPAKAEKPEAGPLGEEDLSSANASVTDNGDGTYAATATGFNGELTATITVEDGAVTAVTDLEGGDNGDEVGDSIFSDTSKLNGTTLETTVEDSILSGATFTRNAVKAMMKAALEAAAQ